MPALGNWPPCFEGRQPMNDQQIARADAELRRTSCYILLAVLIFFALLSYFLEAYLDGTNIDTNEMIRRLYNAVYILGASISLIIYPLWRLYLFGRRVRFEQRFPPQGVKVIRDTEILQGRPAKLRGYLIEICSLLMGILFLAIPIVMYMVLEMFVTGI